MFDFCFHLPCIVQSPALALGDLSSLGLARVQLWLGALTPSRCSCLGRLVFLQVDFFLLWGPRTALQKLLEVVALDGLRAATDELRGSDPQVLAQLSQLVSSLVENDEKLPELEELLAQVPSEQADGKVTSCNLRKTRDLRWETRDTLPEVLRELHDDPHTSISEELAEFADSVVTSISVFDRGGVTHTGERGGVGLGGVEMWGR